MKKIFLSLSLLLFAIPGFTEPIKPVKIDNLVTVSFPTAYQKKDTSGEQIFSANGLFGYMAAIRETNAKNNAPLNKESDLNKVLKDYVNGIQGQAEGSSAQYVRDTTIGALKAKIFTLKTDNGNSEIQYRNFLLLYTKDATYTFEYVYPENRKDLVKNEYKSFVSSIRLSPELRRNDQYLSNASGLSTLNKIEIFGGGALIVILIAVFIARKQNLSVG
ncbi:MAG TPA: hypothetical protein VIM16_08415 [Mucilaginibacter sp.]|jgi:hypothetical protein